MQRIGFILLPGFQIMSLSVMAVFELANESAGGDRYSIEVLSEQGGNVVSSLGVPLVTSRITGYGYDTLLIPGNGLAAASPVMLDYLGKAQHEVRRIGAICRGAFLLAEAGLLKGRRATTHWRFAALLAQGYPDIQVEADRIFITDGAIWTSAGMSAGIDMALAMVEKDLGSDLARDVAKRLVVYHRRAGGQSQYSTLLDLSPRTDRVQAVLHFASQNLTRPLSIEQLAEVANLSPRQFSRQFRSETGKSPAKAVEQLRVEAARLMLEQGHHSLEVVARETGFGDRERMRRAFMRHYGQSPQMIRRTFGPSVSA
ncbi:GlxA family transcriptional regulator [Celeribacter sp.]|uniref:GlxA family transcriptional regulator n=1 Tax=Celeribacter sp. TaxID=1890673 RepID=UPI003A8FD93E